MENVLYQEKGDAVCGDILTRLISLLDQLLPMQKMHHVYVDTKTSAEHTIMMIEKYKLWII